MIYTYIYIGYIYICGQKLAVEVLPLENLLFVESTACSSSLTAKKGAYYAR